MASTINPRTHLEELEREECFVLLERPTLGRLAVVGDDRRPYVFPVNFVVHNETIVFRTDVGTKLHLALGQWVAFECDGVDSVYHTGWSVLVSGIAEVVTTRAEIAELERLPLGVWCAGPKPTWVRLRPMGVSGRRIPPHGSTGDAC
jgi:nitroimidazol reductase NimA-like FMN-containing flavoprotein (pyridoxamine 5'-phosphate oxidase superfamily)